MIAQDFHGNFCCKRELIKLDKWRVVFCHAQMSSLYAIPAPVAALFFMALYYDLPVYRDTCQLILNTTA